MKISITGTYVCDEPCEDSGYCWGHRDIAEANAAQAAKKARDSKSNRPTGIKCGKCKGRHDTVSQVKDCYGSSVGTPSLRSSAISASLDKAADQADMFSASPEPVVAAAEDAVATLPRVAARQGLEGLLAVPAGRYALNLGINNDDGLPHIGFYKVSHGRKGSRWENYTFLSNLVANGMGLAEYPINRHSDRYRDILGAIAEDVQGATALYGQELGECGVCGRDLTDDLSRELGIGPVCRAKRGW